MYSLTPADFADTGQWRLILNIRHNGLDAFLENTIHKDVEIQPFCSTRWDEDTSKLKEHIENAVYSNPRLLDDFATSIILYEQNVMFIPTHLAEMSRESETHLYQMVYSASADDIMTNEQDGISAVWCMAPGVKSFLLRTFPGARISCNLLESVNSVRKNYGKTVCVNFRDDETDIILADGSKLFSATTHKISQPEKIACHILNTLDIYDFKLKDTRFIINGDFQVTEKWEFIKNNSGNYHITR